jgi:putative MATE family efflux protein
MVKQWLHRNKTDINLINSLVIPMLFTQILMLLFQLGDQAIVGRLGVKEFAAVGIASSFIYLITGTIGMLSTAFNIIGGRYLGQNDISKFGESFNTSISLSIIIGIVSEIFILVFGKWILKSIYAIDTTTITAASNYLYISGLGIGMNMILFNFSAYFKNIKKAKILMISFSSAGIVNIILDYTLVFGKFGAPKLGMSGAAIGSVIGFAVSIGINMVFFHRSRLFSFSLHIDKPIAKQLIKLYFPLALQDLIEYTLFAMGIMVIISRMSVQLIAAYTVLTTLMEIIMIPIYGFSGSCITLTAQAYGNKKKDYLKYSYLSSQLMMIIYIPLAFLIIFFPFPLARIITDKESIIVAVQQVLPLFLFVNLINGLQMIKRSTLQAIEHEKWALIYSAFIYTVFLAIIYLLAAKFELVGVYSGFGLCYIFLSLGYIMKLNKTNLTKNCLTKSE